MGYQAVLFCSDERLARVISQVLSEVDFEVEAVDEPFTVVKKLMARHYDAVVVDCEDEQNSSLLFRSARNSSFNQNALAIAVAEGQAGVAKAYRIGANLVLTKPINVEQAKGTLRVARGLLRKSADAAAASNPMAQGMPMHDMTAGASPWGEPDVQDTAPPLPMHANTPQFPPAVSRGLSESVPGPAMNAMGKTEERTAAAAPSAREEAPAAAKPFDKIVAAAFESIANHDAGNAESQKPALAFVPVLNTGSSAQFAAAAPAPAVVKETARPTATEAAVREEPKPAERTDTPGFRGQSEFTSASAASTLDAPTFTAFAEREAAAEPGGIKRILIASVAILTLVMAAYFVWTQFGESHSSGTVKTDTSAQQPSTQPIPVPMASSNPAFPSEARPNREGASPRPAAANNSRAQAGQASAPSERVAMTRETEVKEAEVGPIRVRPDTPAPKTQTDTVTQPPSLVAVETPESNGLSGLMSTGENVAKPTLAQVRISQGVLQGLLIKSVQPKYPASAISAHAQGAVQIEATIDKEGNVVHPKVLSGHKLLAAAALEAVRQWRYKPYYLNGEPVEIQTQITINFKGN